MPFEDEIAAFIRDRLPIAPAPGLPHIRLHTAGPASGLMRLDLDAPPYWARPWGGGLALARHLHDHPETVAGLRVLDLGAGCGLVAVAAAQAGAARVTAVDLSLHAVVATELNAALNDAAVEVVLTDATAGPPLDVDVVLAGDVFYDSEVAARVAPFLDRCVAQGQAVLVGDPYRRPLPQARLEKLADYDVVDFGNAGSTPAAVFAWR